jgi:Zn-dependent M28 family amino/carboxypeptidase
MFWPSHHRFVLTGLALLALGTAPTASQSHVPEAVRTAADRISSAQLAWDLAYLAADDLRGRNTPSEGFDTAADYIIERLRRAGVDAMGDDSGYRQHYDLHVSEVNTAAARIEVGSHALIFGRDFLVRSFAGPLDATLPVVYVGHGWVIPDRQIDPYAGLDVKGKLVLAHGPRVLPKGVDVRQLGRVTIAARSPLAEAERLGAAGVLFITQTSDLVRWDELRSSNLVRRELDPPVPSAYAAPGVTSVLLSPGATQALLSDEPVSGASILDAETTGDFDASFMLKKRVRVRLPRSSEIRYRPYNVVATLRGSDQRLAAEYVTVAAHLDGAVGSRAVNGDSIYNSADDNASGSAALLAIAEQLARGPRPRRSVIFIWDSGEEQGLWGTRRFVHAPPVPLAQIVAHFNVDMIGASRHPGSADERSPGVTERGEIYLTGPAVLSKGVDRLLEQANAAYLKVRFNRSFDTPSSEFFYPRTDAGPFLERGILAIGFFTGMHDRYHLPSDEARFLDPQQLHLMTRMIFVSLWVVADSDTRPAIDQTMPASVPRYR